MRPELRPYQQDLLEAIEREWHGGARSVLAVAPTGSGKTVIKGEMFRRSDQPGIAIAHRQELVSQISLALARVGVPHRVFAPRTVMQFCVSRHVHETGQSWVDAGARTAVASVQTLNSGGRSRFESFLRHVRLWDIDEAHHVLPGNQWGRAIRSLPAGRGAGFTATPIRCDRKTLAESQGGWFDSMVIGPSTRDLMTAGFLSDYRIYGPPPSIDVSHVHVSDRTGEYVQRELVEAAQESRIVGDVVEHYQRLADGKRGLTFCVSVDLAAETAAAFCAAGVPARLVTGKTPDAERAEALDLLASGRLLQLVNVDLFGEGMDCPAIEVVSMARPTQSLGLYMQQFGRLLRPSPGKEYGILIDHAGNVERHGLPDAARTWTLEIPERKRGKRLGDVEPVMPVRTCLECMRVYEAVRAACPYCGARPAVEGRSAPEHVDGDLIEYGPELLRQMRGEIDRIDGPPQIPVGLDGRARQALVNRWTARQDAQQELRDCIAAWAGMWRYGHDADDPEIHRRFYFTFGVDVMTAQTFGATDARTLAEAVRRTMT